MDLHVFPIPALRGVSKAALVARHHLASAGGAGPGLGPWVGASPGGGSGHPGQRSRLGIPRPALGAAVTTGKRTCEIPTLTTRWSELVKQKQQPISPSAQSQWQVKMNPI